MPPVILFSRLNLLSCQLPCSRGPMPASRYSLQGLDNPYRTYPKYWYCTSVPAYKLTIFIHHAKLYRKGVASYVVIGTRQREEHIDCPLFSYQGIQCLVLTSNCQTHWTDFRNSCATNAAQTRYILRLSLCASRIFKPVFQTDAFIGVRS